MEFDINRWDISEDRKEGNYRYITAKCSLCGEGIVEVRKDSLKKRQCLCTREPPKEVIEKGRKFGDLTVIKEVEPKRTGVKPVRMFLLQCICGNVVERQVKSLRQGTRCCGCTHKKPGYPATVKVGDFFTTNQGYEVKIVEYADASNVTIEIQNPVRYLDKSTVQNLRAGSVKNVYHKGTYGVGYLGEIDEEWSIVKPYHAIWTGMIERVHVVEMIDKRPTYRDCSISKPWYCFANFYKWAKDQRGALNEHWQLDKDILVKGNKEYGPDFCAFVPSQINGLFTKREACRGDYPIGVYLHKESGKIRACCSDPDHPGKKISGAFGKTVEEAFNWYKVEKERVIKNQADKWKEQIDEKLYNALYNYKVEITD